MKYIAVISIVFTLIMSLTTSCDDELLYELEIDTVRGLWGNVELYDEHGNALSQLDNITVEAHCTDTIGSGDSQVIVDTTLNIKTLANGEWVLRTAPRGYYTIQYKKEGFALNQVYRFFHDTSNADTISTYYLSKKPQGSVAINSIVLKDNVLEINRTLQFSGSQALSTWYFFDTTANVSSSNYVYAYMAGAKKAEGESQNTLTVLKPIDQLYLYGIKQGQKVYVKAYIDNLKYIQYQTAEKTWEYPNISEGSNTVQFTIPYEVE